MTAVAVNNKETFIAFLRGLSLRSEGLLEPKNCNKVISPTLQTAGKVPIVQEI